MVNTKIGWGRYWTEDGARLKAARGYSAKVHIGAELLCKGGKVN